MTVLVITADDLGLDPRRDAGILDAFARGAITFTSLLVAGPSAQDAATAARKAGLPMGLHLDLTETEPCAPAAQVSTLLDGGKKRGKHGLRAAVDRGEVDPGHVALEVEAQLRRFEALTGAKVTHVDGHQHAHVVPGLVEIIAATLARHGVRSTRIPEQTEVQVSDPGAARFYREVAAHAAAARVVYAREGVRSTDAFVGLDTMARRCRPRRCRRASCGTAKPGRSS